MYEMTVYYGLEQGGEAKRFESRGQNTREKAAPGTVVCHGLFLNLLFYT